MQSTEWEPSWPAWCEQAALAGGEGRLAACVAAYLAHPSMASRKAPLKGFQTWLRSGGWRATASAIEAAEAKGRPAVGRRFEGPADVWEFAVLQLGEANARSYVLPAAWADEGRTLTPRNGVAWERLRKFDWAGVNVTLINPRAGQ